MSWFSRRRQERQLDAELRFHIEEETKRGIEAGMTPEEARRQAVLSFGGPEQVKEDCRDARTFRWLEELNRDLRYAARTLRRSPVFTSVAVLSLALGIGANTAIFSLVDKIMLRTMPVQEPGRLVRFQKFYGTGPGNISNPLFENLRDHTQSFTGMFAQARLGRREITFGGEPEMAETEVVSASYYEVLGVAAVLGRTPTTAERRSPVVVISHGYWKSRFMMDPSVIGKTFRLNNTVFTIIGVTPHDFYGAELGRSKDITLPLELDEQVRGEKSWLNQSGVNWLSVMGRLKPGVPASQAATEVSGFYQRLIQEAAGRVENDPWGKRAMLQERLELEPAGNGFAELQNQFSQPLLVLMGTVALVLLIACTNIANLLLARATTRRKEISVRLAIGAGRGRIIRQLLVESLLLCAVGGIAGIGLGIWLSNSLIRMMSTGSAPLAMAVSPDLRILSFTAALSLFTCLLFGLVPAMQATKVAVTPALKQVSIGGNRWLSRALLTAQIALSLLLLIGAGLFVRTLSNLYHLDPGFEREGVVMFSVNTRKAGYSGERLTNLILELTQRLGALPSVRSASLSLLPPVSDGAWDGNTRVEGYTHRPDEDTTAHFNAVGPGFFQTLGTPVLLGRDIDVSDGPRAPKVAVVNETFARYYFNGASPLGKHVNGAEIVGVVKDMKYRSLRQEVPRTVYFAKLQKLDGPDGQTFYLRTSGTPASFAHAIEKTVRGINPALQMGETITLTEHINRTILNERMMAMLAGSFSTLALIVACLGIYGVMAFQVVRRTNEIGIRMALGAERRDLIWMVMREILGLVLIGTAIGIPAALAVTRLAEAMLFGIKPSDPTTIAAAIVVMTAVALASAYLPARKASLVDPLVALRYE